MKINIPEIKQRLRNCWVCLKHAYWALTYPSDVFAIVYFGTALSVYREFDPVVQEIIEDIADM